ncbi:MULTISPECIES: ParB/RepB/Spo0J family partition protein [Rothia]|uniref:Stage 0 sporulation protein J n=1 Tax=Rothia nasimurium TaxID=85336 RepID=A0A1Y1RQ18_9MICC|nr:MULTISPECIES: ParB/RepB/Spo0J family partition protein [Rothia]ORC20220.1 stage 0 sporulation protein J [Rothia nasimurium]
MAEKKRGLGRGLGALIPEASAPVNPATEKKTVAAQKTTQRPRTTGKGASKQNDVSPRKKTTETSSKNVSRETSKNKRADMRAALHNTTAPRRPVDFFFGDQAATSDEELVPVPGAVFATLEVAEIHPNRKQPRTDFDEHDMQELVHSIKEIGVLQPIVVRPSREQGDQKYELIMGERRWRATQRAGITTIPAIIRETQDEDLLRDALLENLHRSQLNPIEEAAAYQQLLEEFGTTQEQLAQRIGRSRPQISNTIRLLKLPALVQRRVAAGTISSGHARALLGLKKAADIETLAQKIVNEGLSVRAVEELVVAGSSAQSAPSKKAPKVQEHAERLDYLADALGDKLDTGVTINLGARKGKMTIEFASIDDLNRILDLIDPKLKR